MNILAPTKLELLSESPEGNPALQYEYNAFCANAYWTAIYMAYRGHNVNEAAWDWYYDETENFWNVSS